MSKITDFNADLARSQRTEVDAVVRQAIKAQFPEVLAIHAAHSENDKIGVDYWLEFENGAMEALDVKVREEDYTLRGDDRTACLELVANTGTGKAGWAVDPAKRTNWIMFFYVETRKAFTYQARELRSAVIAGLDGLKETGKAGHTRTGGYLSEYLFVSHLELGRAIYRNGSKALDDAI